MSSSSNGSDRDPDSLDPTEQSGRPLMVSGGVLLLLGVLALLVVVGAVVLT